MVTSAPAGGDERQVASQSSSKPTAKDASTKVPVRNPYKATRPPEASKFRIPGGCPPTPAPEEFTQQCNPDNRLHPTPPAGAAPGVSKEADIPDARMEKSQTPSKRTSVSSSTNVVSVGKGSDSPKKKSSNRNDDSSKKSSSQSSDGNIDTQTFVGSWEKFIIVNGDI